MKLFFIFTISALAANISLASPVPTKSRAVDDPVHLPPSQDHHHDAEPVIPTRLHSLLPVQRTTELSEEEERRFNQTRDLLTWPFVSPFKMPGSDPLPPVEAGRESKGADEGSAAAAHPHGKAKREHIDLIRAAPHGFWMPVEGLNELVPVRPSIEKASNDKGRSDGDNDHEATEAAAQAYADDNLYLCTRAVPIMSGRRCLHAERVAAEPRNNSLGVHIKSGGYLNRNVYMPLPVRFGTRKRPEKAGRAETRKRSKRRHNHHHHHHHHHLHRNETTWEFTNCTMVGDGEPVCNTTFGGGHQLHARAAVRARQNETETTVMYKNCTAIGDNPLVCNTTIFTKPGPVEAQPGPVLLRRAITSSPPPSSSPSTTPSTPSDQDYKNQALRNLDVFCTSQITANDKHKFYNAIILKQEFDECVAKNRKRLGNDMSKYRQLAKVGKHVNQMQMMKRAGGGGGKAFTMAPCERGESEEEYRACFEKWFVEQVSTPAEDE